MRRHTYNSVWPSNENSLIPIDPYRRGSIWLVFGEQSAHQNRSNGLLMLKLKLENGIGVGIGIVRVLHKFLMEISELDSHKFLILIKVSLVAGTHFKCQNHMMFACQNVLSAFPIFSFFLSKYLFFFSRSFRFLSVLKMPNENIEMCFRLYFWGRFDVVFSFSFSRYLGRVQHSEHSLENTSLRIQFSMDWIYYRFKCWSC